MGSTFFAVSSDEPRSKELVPWLHAYICRTSLRINHNCGFDIACLVIRQPNAATGSLLASIPRMVRSKRRS